MIHNKKLRKLSLWLVVLSLLSASLAPSITRILFEQDIPLPGFESGQSLSSKVAREIPDCHPAPDSDGGFPSGHCLFCFIAGCPIELTPVAVASRLFRMAKPPLPLLALSVPYVQPIWEPNRARAPPAFL
ncbi:MAG: hypothetical protein LBE15_04760 [Burkholderiales bacterium]|jgi:membrane-associated phospholipid phosphatase|nr:hypothetical protein [Burkholderiales bacterium]